MQSKRKVRSGGRPRVVRQCGGCGLPFSARELRAHMPHCKGGGRQKARTAS